MKKIFVVFVMASPVWGAPCGGAPTSRWINPDSSQGGFVGTGASAQAGAFIALNAEVCDGAKLMNGSRVLENAHVGGRAIILAGGEIAGRARVDGEVRVGGASGIATKVYGDAVIDGSSVISGSSKVFARAKVTGASKVHNGIICQASVIESLSVGDSYYCQNEDPEPPHPGEIGKKTLLGVDTDRDGVRDDIEIWLNDRYSNTAKIDNSFVLKARKFQAYYIRQAMKWKDSKEKVIQSFKFISDGADCIEEHYGSKALDYKAYHKLLLDLVEDSRLHMNEFLNTFERAKSWETVLSKLNGTQLTNSGKKDMCEFKRN